MLYSSSSIATEASNQPLSVSEFNQQARLVLETNLERAYVRGEISNLTIPSSGHAYFTLKDKQACVRCVMFAINYRRLNLNLSDGLLVDIKARVSLYEPTGQFQLIVSYIQNAGHGELHALFEARKHELLARGWLDSDQKRPLPRYPKTIGVITSPTGAAVRDVLKVLARRYPCAQVRLYPTLVQGIQAADTIVTAIKIAIEEHRADVLIIARGGGSLEDLWPFNEMAVVEALYHCPIPVISGVGHETDITLVDYICDQRAPTPSAAAELATPDRDQLQQHLQHHHHRLLQCTQNHYRLLAQRIEYFATKLERQSMVLSQWLQTLDHHSQRLQQAWRQQYHRQYQKIEQCHGRLQAQHPQRLLQQQQQWLAHKRGALCQTMRNQLQAIKQQLSTASQALQTLSPERTLERGYAIIQDNEGKLLSSVKNLTHPASLCIRMKDGTVEATTTPPSS